DAGNYTLTQPATTADITPPTLTLTADDQPKEYRSTNPALTASHRGLVAGDTAPTPATVTTTATDSSTVGTYSITASGAVDANYTIGYVPGTMTVTPVLLTATAANASRNSGEVNPTLTGTLVGVRNGD